MRGLKVCTNDRLYPEIIIILNMTDTEQWQGANTTEAPAALAACAVPDHSAPPVPAAEHRSCANITSLLIPQQGAAAESCDCTWISGSLRKTRGEKGLHWNMRLGWDLGWNLHGAIFYSQIRPAGVNTEKTQIDSLLNQSNLLFPKV